MEERVEKYAIATAIIPRKFLDKYDCEVEQINSAYMYETSKEAREALSEIDVAYLYEVVPINIMLTCNK